jgi:hypothetical protein
LSHTWPRSRRLGATAASIAVLVVLCVSASAARADVTTECGAWNTSHVRLHVRACADFQNTSFGPVFRSFVQADMRVQVPALVTACRIYMVESADDRYGHHVLQNTWRDCSGQARLLTDFWTGSEDYAHDTIWTLFSSVPGSCKHVQGRIDLTYQGRVIRSGTADYSWDC